jgi:nucleotide-binding universal stress UspA family protein
MAQLFNSSIRLLHVLERPACFGCAAPFVPETEWLALRGRGSVALAEMAREDFGGFNVTPVVRQGDPATAIAAFAATREVDLIMMPTHGSGRYRAALLGSVTAKVLDDVHCPVWTSAHPERFEPDSCRGLHSILCAIDLSPESGALVRSAATFGAKTGATVRLVHAVPGEENGLQQSMNLEFERYLRDCARDSVRNLQRETHTAFDLCLEAGRPSRVIAAAARHHEADLVVIGRGKLDGLAGRLRTGVYSIVRDSPCPVLSL